MTRIGIVIFLVLLYYHSQCAVINRAATAQASKPGTLCAHRGTVPPILHYDHFLVMLGCTTIGQSRSFRELSIIRDGPVIVIYTKKSRDSCRLSQISPRNYALNL